MTNPVLKAQWREVEPLAGAPTSIRTSRRANPARPRCCTRDSRSQRVEAIVIGIDALTQAHRTQIVAGLALRRLPGISREREFVDAGGLISYGIHYADSYRRAAAYVAKVLKGARPADLPVEQPTKLELVINLKTAKALGLTIPPSLLARADHVIE